MIIKLLTAAFIISCLHSCVVPVPHRRVHVPGAKGQVLDSRNDRPIEGARIHSQFGKTVLAVTDSEGRYQLKPVYGWHGAYMFGPISYSLFPHFDMPHGVKAFWVSAMGYEKKPCVDGGITRLIPASVKR